MSAPVPAKPPPPLSGGSGTPTPLSRRPPATDAALICLVLAAATVAGFSESGYRLQLTTDIAMFVVLAYSWNLISGFTGYVSLGHVSFFGLGGYATALLIVHWHWNWLAASLAAGVLAALVAVPLGMVMLRLRGIYFALGMLGLVQIMSIASSSWEFVGASTGLALPAVLAQKQVYAVMVALAVVAFLLNLVTARSRFGLRAMAIRDDENAARAMGVRTTRSKVTAFVLSAILPAVAGGLVVWNRSFVDPEAAFDPTIDLQAILFVLAGGIGTIWGPMIGAVALSLVGEQLWARYGDLHLGLFGGLIVVIVLFLPGGIASLLERVRLLRRPIVMAPKELPAAQPTLAPPELVPGEPILDCRDVSVSFGGVRAIDGIDLRVAPGETVFIIGANGAGKTTLLNSISGFVKPSSGEVSFKGLRVGGRSIAGRARDGIGRTFQVPCLFDSLTVWENVLVPSLSGQNRRQASEHAARVIRICGLDELWLEPVSSLAAGHRRQVELARALGLGPDVILLDEAMAGMNHEEVERVRCTIRNMQSLGVSAVAGVEHVIHAIVDLADRIVVLDRGRKIADGPAAEVLRDPVVIDSYLGEEVAF